MIIQTTSQELKTLISKTSRNLKFYLLTRKEDEFSVDFFEVIPKDGVNKESRDSISVSQLPFFLQKKDSYPVYHLVDRPAMFLRETFGDDNAKDFITLCNKLYYRHLDDEVTHGILDELIGLFKREYEVAEGLLDKEFEQDT